jgi:hypothetical protein
MFRDAKVCNFHLWVNEISQEFIRDLIGMSPTYEESMEHSVVSLILTVTNDNIIPQ